MEDTLRDSDLDRTIVRPPKLTDKPLTGAYRIAFGQNLRGGWDVSRADVAQYMLRAVQQPETIRPIIGIANQPPLGARHRPGPGTTPGGAASG